MPEKQYKGWRDDTGIHVTVNDEPLQHLPYHSPDGFEWGDSGRGSADLALAFSRIISTKWTMCCATLVGHGSPSACELPLSPSVQEVCGVRLA